jgi:tetratricopeptide (TPR) repeat protein
MPRRVLKFAALCGLLGTVFCGQSIANEQPEPAPTQGRSEKSPPAEIRITGGYLKTWATENDGDTRILLLRVSVTNHGSNPMTISPKAWKLTVEGRVRSVIPAPSDFDGITIHVNRERVELGNVKTDTLNPKPGSEAATWLLFKNLPDSAQIPEMTLSCEIPDVGVVSVDVDETFTNRLKLQSQLIGPADAIVLLTIDGSLDTVNVGKLFQKIDEISATQARRAILNFGPDAKVPENDVAGWLRTVATQSGRNPVVNEDFPPLPTAVVDFHLVNYLTPVAGAAHVRLHSVIRRLNLGEGSSSSRNVHDELIAAVDSAVTPLCESLPRDELIRSVRNGDNTTKAAVLRHAAERLSQSSLPQILSLTDDADLNVSTAAIFALRSSSSDAATQKLVALATNRNRPPGAAAKSTSEVRRTVALHSLVASKYATAHPEVMRLLSINDEFLLSETANAIVAHPRPVWSEPLAALIGNSPAKTQVHLLPALAAVGHPRLLTILEQCLASDQRHLSSTALNILIARDGPAAEQLTSQWILKSLETSSPSPVLLAFLRRTRDHRAIPMLLRHLSEKQTDRHELLSTILTIGDHRITEQIAAGFEKYNFTEQLLILRALAEVHSKLFWTLSSSVIARSKTSDDKSLEGVVSLLRQNGSDRAVKLLIDVLTRLAADDDHSKRHVAVVCAALASTGTSEARDALRDVAHNSKTAASTARQSLIQLYERSPAKRYVLQGGNHIGQAMRLAEQDNNINKVEQAKRKAEAQRQINQAMLYLNAAIEVDPELPDARRWRGNAALHIERPTAQELETAQQDFARYVELEPDESEGHTGLALVLVRQGKVEAGLAAGMAIRKKSKDDSVYFYNMACIYGRAIEQLEASPDAEMCKQQLQIEKYRSQGVKLLQQSIDNGLDDDNLVWMQQDPDLITIRQSPAFEALLKKTLGSDKDAPDQKVPAKP